MPIVFQYGSNCDTDRLNDATRLSGQAKPLGAAQTVENFQIAFNKQRQVDGSAAADLITHKVRGRRIWGVLYEVSQGNLDKLAQVEGPSYRAEEINVEDATGAKAATTFRVLPKKRKRGLWTASEYVEHIVKGLRSHSVPEDYVWYVIERAELANGAARDWKTAEIETAGISNLRGLLLSPKYGLWHWKELKFQTEDEWQRAIDIVENRIRERFVGWVDELIPKRFAGFVTTALDCLLLETLYGFVAGGSTKDTRKAYTTILKDPPFQFADQLAEDFYEGVRNGIIHDTETRKGWRIRMKPQKSMVEKDSSSAYVLNRTMFHEALKSAFSDWIAKMRFGDVQLRNNMRCRMDELIQKHFAI